jgi:hypothetical protein
MEDLLLLMRANLRVHVAMLNELSGCEGAFEVEDFMNEDGEGS